MRVWLGIDVACRAAHQASLADERGRFAWSGRKFRTTVEDLHRLWAMLPAGVEPAAVTVIMEPTRNAWVPLAAWFRRQGATVVMVPPEQSADLRSYYAKHTKSDRLDSKILAKLPLLHPDGLHTAAGLGPGESLRRAVKLRSNLVKRRTSVLARLDALLELLGPSWHAALGADLANKTPLRFLAHYADPHQVRRLGRARLARFLHRHSRGSWGETQADGLLAAANETLALWADELDYPDLADDIAIEARLALHLTEEIKDLEERIKVLLARADPAGIVQSVPGVGPILAAQILGRLGDPSRFTSLAAIRSYAGLVPGLNSSGLSSHHSGPTKSGDACLREALFLAAQHARRTDPTLAAKYHRLMTVSGKHHNSALCHIATTLLTRIAACWRRGETYQLTDIDNAPISVVEARRLITDRYTVPAELRAARRATQQQKRTDRRHKESHSAPTNGPSTTQPTDTHAA
ncbi:IS110 family transposase [Amycolatopsis sp. DG1A-15b]|uniref:IS110 family transposase n=1 Tax=Amycolatopsis sp. DG1A-15b TaxID=3052846 RepID=UPI00255B4A2D|nr:IS110 family transposase [Amycolatopsis sp. DG1A-15b]WIX86861.1 IS110 family transposase [Amycolatopsis sp. DG1A-15b]